MNETLNAFADYLERREEELLHDWQERVQESGRIDSARSLSLIGFRDHIPSILEALYGVLRDTPVRSKSREAMDVRIHGHWRWKQGFSLEELVIEWEILNESLFTFVQAFMDESHSEPAHNVEALRLITAFVADGRLRSIRQYEKLRVAEAKRLQQGLEEVRECIEPLSKRRIAMLREAVHDIKGGLSAISGASDIIKCSEEDFETMEEMSNVIAESVEAVVGMLDSLLDLARLEAGQEEVQLATVDVGRLLRTVCETYDFAAAEKDLDFEMDGPERLEVRTDAMKVRRIVGNLLCNAVRYTEVGQIRVRWEETDGGWRVTVKDSGPGMKSLRGFLQPGEDEAEAQTGTNQVQRGRSLGEGIGLSIVNRLSEMLNASVNVTTADGEGTEVHLTFPENPVRGEARAVTMPS